MAELQDQRQMTGPTILETEQQIRDFWAEKGRTEGFRMRQVEEGLNPPHELREDVREVRAYVSDGRWVADCLNCAGGIAAGPRFSEGACLGCGTVFRLRHPDPEQIQAAVEILAMRPLGSRHWRPWRETADDLARENELHGFIVDEDSARGELEIVAAKTRLPLDTVRRVVAAQEALGNR